MPAANGSAASVAARIPSRPPRLVLRFALYTAIAFGLAAAATLWFEQRAAVGRAESSVSFHTRFVANTILRDRLRPSDFRGPVSGARLQALDRLFRREVLTGGAVRVKLYEPNGFVVYSNDHGLIGSTSPEADAIAKAFGGRTLRDVTNLNHEGGSGPDKKVLEVYTPVRARGKKVGVFELYQDYAPVAKSIRNDVYPLAIILGVALFVLFVALLPILRRTTNALLRSLGAERRSQEALEQAEGQLRQAQKMEAVGQLAGGVAHDFNNLLLAIRGYGELALQRLDGSNDAVRADLVEMQDAVDRATQLTQRLLAFSRKQVLQPRVFDLSHAIAEFGPVLRRLIGAQVAIETSLAGSAPVRADPTQFEQVLVNLAVNGRDAMPDGGTLSIETTTVELDEEQAALQADAEPGSYVVLAVRDTGHGMDREMLSHLFEPFFTTKEEGKGTGLGLATVYGIVKQSGGFVTVQSEPGMGSEFRVHLPRSPEGVPVSEPAPAELEAPHGAETILLVEDEDTVRELLVRLLERQGYRVLAAADGHEALRISESLQGPVDLLLTDVVLPRMNGPKVAAAIREQRPSTRVLFISGYAGEAFRTEIVEPGEAFLRKPFSVGDLARKVRETLEAEVAVS
jgi:signal transduction histidine kinase/ActR/RegA family two-component response regulator